MTRKTAIYISLIVALVYGFANAKGKLAGYAGGIEREAAVYSRTGLEAWTITGPSGSFEFSLEPGEYMVSCGGQLAPYVRIREGETTYINHSEQPQISMESELWTPNGLSFGQTYVATGTALSGVSFWMPGGSTKLRLTLREEGPDGKLIGQYDTPDRHQWITWFHPPAEDFPTVPGKVYYLELMSTEGISWNISAPRKPDVYSGGIAYFDRVPHPESDLGITIHEVRPGIVRIAAAQVDQHYIAEGPGSGTCKVAGQTFVAKNGRNIIAAYANCGFQGPGDFVFSIYKGGVGGELVISKDARMVSNWGTTAYFLPDEVVLEPGKEYYFEYKRANGEPFYSYLSADVYPEGRAYRDGKEVEGFDQYFEILGEVEPGGITYPYNVKVSEITPDSARISWETGTKADGIVYYGEDQTISQSVDTQDKSAIEHSVRLENLRPGTIYYFRATSYTGKQGSSRSWSRMDSFMTLPTSDDKPRFDRPEPVRPVPPVTPSSVPLLNGSFEEGMKGWKVCWFSDTSKSEPDFNMPDGPYGGATEGQDGYKPHSGRLMYGWRHSRTDDPYEPGEVWKQDIIHQRVRVKRGTKYVLKAWILTGDRGSGWGGDSRARLVVDTSDSGLLNSVESASKAVATQWFATRNDWELITLHFTATRSRADIGVHLLQWFSHEACYLYVDDLSLEKVD